MELHYPKRTDFKATTVKLMTTTNIGQGPEVKKKKVRMFRDSEEKAKGKSHKPRQTD